MLRGEPPTLAEREGGEELAPAPRTSRRAVVPHACGRHHTGPTCWPFWSRYGASGRRLPGACALTSALRLAGVRRTASLNPTSRARPCPARCPPCPPAVLISAPSRIKRYRRRWTAAASTAGLAAKACLEFLVLTAARSGEARRAMWAEIDLTARTWTIPAERMKGSAEHRVPLSDAAITVLEQAAVLRDELGLLFPGLLRPGLG